MKANWIFAGTVTWFLAVIVPVIHKGMCNLAHEIHFVGVVLHKPQTGFQHISQPWISPFHDLPTSLLIYLWGMIGLGGVMVLVGLIRLIRNTEP